MVEISIGHGEKNPLLLCPIPETPAEQLEVFTLESLRAKRVVMNFSLQEMKAKMETSEGKRVMAIDIGGSKIAATTFVVRNGSLYKEIDSLRTLVKKGGEDFLPFLEALAKEASAKSVPVGISTTGIVEKTHLKTASRIPILFEQLQKHERDFAKLFPTLSAVSNDAVAGIIGGCFEASTNNYINTQNVIFLINGSGIGGAVLKGGEIWATEPGHVEAIPELNPFNQESACPLLEGRITSCIANCAGGRAIETIWYQQTGGVLSSKEIGILSQQSDDLALKLYNSSAKLASSVARGMMQAFDLDQNSTPVTIICHGGMFEMPEYGKRVTQILQKNLGSKPNIIFTKGNDACLSGAAIATLK